MKSNRRRGVKRHYLYCTLWPKRMYEPPRGEEDNEFNAPFMGVGYLSATGADAWSCRIERISTGVSRERLQ
jgi:hypothetical protein